MKIQIKNGHLIDPASGVNGKHDIFIAAGKIAAIGIAPEGFHANKTIDATGLIVCPGLVDLSARLREPGYEYKATLESEMLAAMAGGVTSLVCPPDTEPVLDEPGLVEMLKFRAKNLQQAHVYPLGALTVGLKGEVITEMAELTEAGCIGFAQAEFPITDTQVMLHAFQYANTFDFTVWLRPQDPYLGRGVAHSGPVAARLGLSGVSVMSETLAMHTIFELMRASGARVHLCRISSAAGVALVRAAKAEGLRVSCDVAIHNVLLTDVDIGYFDSNYHLQPPLRSGRDRDAIWQGLADGTIDAIVSDHTPVDDDEKLLPFGESSPGATGLELLLTLTLKWAEQQKVDLSVALAKVTASAAQLAGIDAGHCKPGSSADLCLFDPNLPWTVVAKALQSQGKNTPFLGYELTGKTVMTLVAGEIRYQGASLSE
ncbi:dihydroorotase [Ampullimonas aquatilis]|uniref:dihydroorotase n=1 Tax=Ampullimonas aquatilis TaxID=1341549 RepID=UPI003C726151